MELVEKKNSVTDHEHDTMLELENDWIYFCAWIIRLYSRSELIPGNSVFHKEMS